VVAVKNGSLRGSVAGDLAVYKGIPYAAPPVGELRWKAPQPAASWTGVRDATAFGPSAIQPEQAPFMCWSEEFIIDGIAGYSEDCLYLNVWTKTSGPAKRPVLVFVHGGGFTSGGSSCEVYDGQSLAEQGLVYVSINYRVGVLGFLAHPELSSESPGKVSGNYALLDCIAALQWVRDNITSFGGDPANVTIMGQSAGAGMVNALLVSPPARNLFHRAVSESLNNLTMPYTDLVQAEEAGKAAFGARSIAEMRSLPAEELITLASPGLVKDDLHLPEQYIDAIRQGLAHDVPLMTGMVEGDSMLFGMLPPGDDYQQRLSALFGDHAGNAFSLYPEPGELNADGLMALQSYIPQLRRTPKGGAANTWVYFFTHVMPGPESAQWGAFHTADVPYFFDFFSSKRVGYWTQDDYDLGRQMSAFLVSFAKTGKPELAGASWPASDGGFSWFRLDTGGAMRSLGAEKSALWRNLLDPLLGIDG
jgi:para-nitrobenzyl esterase